ncbi:MAG: AEC family transporter [Spirochaetes bacterium]|nr:AEC family transporter [Spirochaetota bacterium]
MNQTLFPSLILVILLAAGFAAGKFRILTHEATQGLSKFLVDFTLPALVIVSMQKPYSAETRDEALTILGISVAVYAAAIPLAFLLTGMLRVPLDRRGVHRFAACFSNVGFMGFPVMEALFGKDALFAVSVYNIPFQILAFSVGVVMIAGGGRKERISAGSFMNPAVLAAVAGFAFFLMSVRIPEPLMSALRILGDTTTPLSMAVIGAILSRADPRRVVGDWRVYATSAYRTILFPLALFGVLAQAGLKGFPLVVPVMIAAMPVAANTTILANVYGGDAETAGSLVFLSTAASLVTLPAIASLLFGV